MSFSAQDIAAMEEALKTGELEVRRGDRALRYRSIDELIKAINYAKEQAATAAQRGAKIATWHY